MGCTGILFLPLTIRLKALKRKLGWSYYGYDNRWDKKTIIPKQAHKNSATKGCAVTFLNAHDLISGIPRSIYA